MSFIILSNQDLESFSQNNTITVNNRFSNGIDLSPQPKSLFLKYIDTDDKMGGISFGQMVIPENSPYPVKKGLQYYLGIYGPDFVINKFIVSRVPFMCNISSVPNSNSVLDDLNIIDGNTAIATPEKNYMYIYVLLIVLFLLGVFLYKKF